MKASKAYLHIGTICSLQQSLNCIEKFIGMRADFVQSEAVNLYITITNVFLNDCEKNDDILDIDYDGVNILTDDLYENLFITIHDLRGGLNALLEYHRQGLSDQRPKMYYTGVALCIREAHVLKNLADKWFENKRPTEAAPKNKVKKKTKRRSSSKPAAT